ncbi:hypothetical protein [Blastococcus sp. CT_GayMR16]|uniref:hypothetical protein n=1 Tax=Blastococcus sp. CT_GayMR16 TaxID=2559607 RepID=UPI001073E3FB|nr:hypothetical protein [Blastococcus sp. CT_GayMR16]TFV87802.1 hypothetical protein E4P38_12575 [Blastococcus sp. CT_GayMR16]
MPVPHRSPRRRSRIAAIIAAVLLPIAVPAAAAADDAPSSGETVVGELVQAWPEYEDHDEAAERGAEGPLTWIETEDGGSVRVSTDDLQDGLPGAGAPVGATVEVVVGDEVDGDPGTEDGLEPALEVLSAEVVEAAPAEEPPVAAAATDVVTVVMMIPGGGTAEPGRTLAQVEAAISTSVAAFWSGQSGDTIRITTAAGNDPAWVPATVDCSRPNDLWNQAAAAAPGWDAGPGRNHLLVYLPRNSPGCAYGLAQVGGGKLYVTDVAPSVIAHELGHNLGLGHSSGRQCDAGPESGSCRTESYRDYYDVMGVSWQQIGSLNAAQAVRLGLLPTGQQQVVPATGAATTYELAPLSGTTGTRALKLVDPDGVVYWLEYRTATGQDSWLAPSNRFGLQTGVLLHRAAPFPASSFYSDTSILLDGSPSAASGWNSDLQVALPLGRSVAVSYGVFNVTVTAVSGTSASIRVVPGPSLRGWTAATNKRPAANWEALSASGTTVSVGGWAFDPDSPTVAGEVHVYVDGGGTALTAATARPDVGAVFPQAGADHGFAWSGTLSPGVHTVCVYAIDAQLSWANTPLGCRAVAVAVTRPWGNWEVLSASGTTITVGGWAFDPDSATTAGQVHVYVDGRGTPLTAAASRPDVGAAFPEAGADHGFGWSGTVDPGLHTVCVYAIDGQLPWSNTGLGCRTVAVALTRPYANWEVLSASGSTVTVGGWAFDPDAPTAVSQVHVYVDGEGAAIIAGGSRPDVGAAFAGAGGDHGFGHATTVSPGRHTVCLYAVDVQITWLNTPLGCRSITT